jgi:allantoin racemase
MYRESAPIHSSGEVTDKCPRAVLFGLREFGINESGVLTALARGDRFGVLAIGQRSIRRHLRYLRQMGLLDRLANERPLDLSVADTASGANTLAKMIAVGKELRDKDGADVIIMGCAGMARHRGPLEAELGIPVIDPTQAAAIMALGAIVFSSVAPR